jgi:hypothetical protein
LPTTSHDSCHLLQAEGYDISAAVSALEKLAALARQHAFHSSHSDPESGARILLWEETGESVVQNTRLATLPVYDEMLIVALLNLVRIPVNWVLSLL